MFYEGKNEEPIKVDGTLVVYAFDETNRDANNARPDRKYVFTPQQLPLHYSKSKVGHSYSVWMPWDEVGGVQKEITLIVRFQPKEEAPVAISDPCRQLLPGRVETARAQCPREFSSRRADRADAGGCGQLGQRPHGDAAALATACSRRPTSPRSRDGPDVMPRPGQERRIMTTTIDVPSGSVIRSAINFAPGCRRRRELPNGSGAELQPNCPAPNYQPQNYPPQNLPAEPPWHRTIPRNRAELGAELSAAGIRSADGN